MYRELFVQGGTPVVSIVTRREEEVERLGVGVVRVVEHILVRGFSIRDVAGESDEPTMSARLADVALSVSRKSRIPLRNHLPAFVMIGRRWRSCVAIWTGGISHSFPKTGASAVPIV